MPTSRPIRAGEWLLCLRGDVAAQKIATGNEDPNNYVLQEDFGIHRMDNDPFWLNSGERVFAVPGVRVKSDPRITAAITNGTAPASTSARATTRRTGRLTVRYLHGASRRRWRRDGVTR